jgi:hypothetical protein
MYVVIKDHDPAKAEAIQTSASNEWDFEDWYSAKDDDVDKGIEMSATGQANLCGGEGEQEFSERLCNAIWEANGKYCEVEVTCTYMESLPHEDYSFDEEDYARWQAEKIKVQ